MTSSVIFDSKKDQAGLFHILIRALDPRCDIRTGLKVFYDGKIIIENGIQVFNFLSKKRENEFLHIMDSFSKRVILSDYLYIETISGKRKSKKEKEEIAYLHLLEGNKDVPLGNITYKELAESGGDSKELTIYTDKSRYVKNISLIIIGAIGNRYPEVYKLAKQIHTTKKKPILYMERPIQR